MSIEAKTPQKQTKDELTISVKKNEKNDKYLFDIIAQDGFSKLEINLKPEQEIFANGSMMSYIYEGVEKGILHFSLKGFIGRLVTGENQIYFLLQGKEEATRKNNKVAFASFLPGSIGYAKIDAEEEIYLTNKSFIASSPNVKLSSGLNLAGIFGFASKGMFIPKITISNAQTGHLWMGAYGSLQEHKLQKNESILINSGMFIAIKKSKKHHHLYDIEKLGKSFFASLFGSDHIFGMRIYGPCTVYTQSHDINNFLRYIQLHQQPQVVYKNKRNASS